jgi:hypothetical protein
MDAENSKRRDKEIFRNGSTTDHVPKGLVHAILRTHAHWKPNGSNKRNTVPRILLTGRDVRTLDRTMTRAACGNCCVSIMVLVEEKMARILFEASRRQTTWCLYGNAIFSSVRGYLFQRKVLRKNIAIPVLLS